MGLGQKRNYFSKNDNVAQERKNVFGLKKHAIPQQYSHKIKHSIIQFN